MTQPHNTRCLLSEAQWRYLRGTLRHGWRSIIAHPAVARHCAEKGFGKVKGLRFYANAKGRAIFES